MLKKGVDQLFSVFSNHNNKEIPMKLANQLVSIFCQIDDFCKELESYNNQKLLTGSTRGKRGPQTGLSQSEMMTILVMFHEVRFKDFKME